MSHVHLLSTENSILQTVYMIIIWLTPWAGKMNQILRCDWLPERARWSYLVRSGLPAVSRKKNFSKSHIINPLLNKLVRSRWLDIGLVLFFFFASLWTETEARSINMQKKNSMQGRSDHIRMWVRAYMVRKARNTWYLSGGFEGL